MNIADDSTAIIIGSGGGIGKALKQELFKENYYRKIICFSKTNDIQLDITDENAIMKVTNELKRKNIKINLLINAVGYLHDKNFFPEKKISEISNDYLINSFKLNSIGHALIIKYFNSLFSEKEKSFLVCLSARVGSISDNYLGGWYGYRASKAALNQIVRSASIELKRKKPNLVLASVHPGTVYTKLSKPFIKESKCFSTNESAKKILKTIYKLTKEDSGKFIDYQGKVIPY
ncbi:MAG: hypothetical protein CMJ08_04895 [Pelagibacterales bacterium]|nr:hypothetical protein [Pelagibacterales bacterium]